MLLEHCCYRTNLEPHKRHPTTTVGTGTKATGLPPGRQDTRPLIAILKKPE